MAVTVQEFATTWHEISSVRNGVETLYTVADRANLIFIDDGRHMYEQQYNSQIIRQADVMRWEFRETEGIQYLFIDNVRRYQIVSIEDGILVMIDPNNNSEHRYANMHALYRR